MSFNQVENLFLEMAIRELEKQLIKLGEWPQEKGGQLYLGQGINFMILSDNRLTILDKNGTPRKDITPVNCYNFYRPMSLVDAINEYLDRQKNPEKYETPFFI